jgi:hypothetical protein
MSEKIVSIYENDNIRSEAINAVDPLDREIDAVWGLIAIIEVIHRETGGDHYASGALRVAHNHQAIVSRAFYNSLGAQFVFQPPNPRAEPLCAIGRGTPMRWGDSGQLHSKRDYRADETVR